jgi:hypothetical protein
MQAVVSAKDAPRARTVGIGLCTAVSNSTSYKVSRRRQMRSRRSKRRLKRLLSPLVTSTSHVYHPFISMRLPSLRQASFLKADWNLQIFRFRSRRVETTEFAYDALMFQNYQNTARLRSAPLDYLLSQLEVVLENWNALLTASSHFLESFVSVNSQMNE